MPTEAVHVPGFVGERELPLTRLYRYMPVEACHRMVDRGEVRVSSSSNFDRDETLSETRRDDEQSKQVSTVLHKLRKVPSVRKGFRVDVQQGEETPSGTETTFKSHVDDPFWILSLSTDLTPVLFDEFDEPAAVEILDPEEFIRRLENASAQILLGPNDIFGYRRVQYADSILAYGDAGNHVESATAQGCPLSFAKGVQGGVAPETTGQTARVDIRRRRLGGHFEGGKPGGPDDGVEEEVRFPEDAIAEYQRTNTPTLWEQAATNSVRNIMEFAERSRRDREGDGDSSRK